MQLKHIPSSASSVPVCDVIISMLAYMVPVITREELGSSHFRFLCVLE